MKVKANFDYNDILLKRLVKKDEVIEVDDVRAKVLTTELYNGVPFCNIVEEKQKEKEEDKELLEPKEPLEENKDILQPKEDLDEVVEEKPKRKRTRKAKVEE